MDLFDIREWFYFNQALSKECSVDHCNHFLIDQVAIDSRKIKGNNALFIALEGQKTNGHDYLLEAYLKGAKYAVVNEKHPLGADLPPELILLKVPSSLKALQEIAFSYRKKYQGEIVAIGGTFGKTMLKEFLHTLLKGKKSVYSSPGSYNSQIGVPLSLLSMPLASEIALIEIGFSKPSEIDPLIEIVAPNSAIITPIESRYLASFKTDHEIAIEWTKLAQSAKKWCLIPNQLKAFPKAYAWNESGNNLPHAKQISIKGTAQLDYRIEFPNAIPYESSVKAGFHYFVDLLNMGIKSAKLLGIDDTEIKARVSEYTPSPIRSEMWHSPDNTLYINENNFAHVDSFKEAFCHFLEARDPSNSLFLYTSLHAKDGDATVIELAELIVRTKIGSVFAIDTPLAIALKDALKTLFYTGKVDLFQTFEEMLAKVSYQIRPAGVVLIKGSTKLPLERLLHSLFESPPRNECRVHLAAIRENILQLRSHLPQNTRIMAMVKAKAYGTNDSRMAAFFSSCGIDILGVSSVDEGAQLKSCGCPQDIFVIHTLPDEASRVVKWGLQTAICNRETYIALSNEAKRQNKKTIVHLHINTGMNRFGCRIEESLDLARTIAADQNLILDGVMTHFACAENPAEDAFSEMQIDHFNKAIEQIENAGIALKWRHAANSGASIRHHLPQYNMVRVGLAVYGLHSSSATRDKLPLKTAISLYSKVSSISTLKKGESVSYGRRFITDDEMTRIAVLPIGYFDGLHRHYSGKGHVLVRGEKAPMVGSICMDYMMIDVTKIPNVAIGDTVLLFGGDEHRHYLPPEAFAESGNSIIYELMTCLGPRIQRIFIDEEAASKINKSG